MSLPEYAAWMRWRERLMAQEAQLMLLIVHGEPKEVASRLDAMAKGISVEEYQRAREKAGFLSTMIAGAFAKIRGKR